MLTVRLPGFLMPRIVIHRCSASESTMTPLGCMQVISVRNLVSELFLELELLA